MKIKEIRKKKKLRLVDLARATGISLGYLWLIEEGYEGLSEEKKRKIAKALGVNLEEIFPEKRSE